jgi:hypothetical protein
MNMVDDATGETLLLFGETDDTATAHLPRRWPQRPALADQAAVSFLFPDISSPLPFPSWYPILSVRCMHAACLLLQPSSRRHTSWYDHGQHIPLSGKAELSRN